MERSKTCKIIEISQETLEHLDPLRKMFAEELIRKGEWRIVEKSAPAKGH